MALLDKLNHWIFSTDWLGVTRILVIQVIVLSALSFAVVRYIDWASDVTPIEFTGSIGQTASVAVKHTLCPTD